MPSNNTTPQTILVDSSDPHLSYEGPWNLKNISIPDDLSNLALPSSALPSVSPMYGTLHTIEEDPNPTVQPAFIVYTYNGSNFTAFFRGNFTDANMIVCKLDGTEQPSSANFGEFQCLNNLTVPEGQHQLEFVVPRSTIVSFDYLTYTTLSPPQENADLYFNKVTPGILNDPNEPFEFTFHGISLGIYMIFSGEFKNPLPPSNLLYTVDGSNPVNFTFNHPLGVFSNVFSVPQVLLQTPRLPVGEHQFKLTLLPPIQENQAFISFDAIAVQNSALDLNVTLDVFPGANLPTVSKANSKSNASAIIGGVIGGLALLCLLIAMVYVILRHRRRSVILKTWWERWNARSHQEIGLSDISGRRE